ncbi:BPG-independent PGAM domain protein [candidate division TM7 genomosp. GTL1]|nr:BPG-independent PGAM domain protein [candidate division TM7 genomosp. GTL1]
MLIEAIELAKQRGKALHILGLVSPGGVHSHTNGALALVKLAKELELTNVHVHAFTDGRDTPPMSSLAHIKEFEAELEAIGNGRVASIAGRYYAMDRDNRWERIELAYEMLIGERDAMAHSATHHIATSYEKGETDEFLRPISIAHQPDCRTHAVSQKVSVESRYGNIHALHVYRLTAIFGQRD